MDEIKQAQDFFKDLQNGANMDEYKKHLEEILGVNKSEADEAKK